MYPGTLNVSKVIIFKHKSDNYGEEIGNFKIEDNIDTAKVM